MPYENPQHLRRTDRSSANSSNESGRDDCFEQVAELVDDLTAYQLYRLRAHVDSLLEDPQRLNPSAIVSEPGLEIEYYCTRVNRCVKAIVDKVNRTTVDVTNLEDGKRWRIELAAVNTGGAEERIRPKTASHQLTRYDLSPGQTVGFQDQHGQEKFGRIIRLNPKTVTMECESGTKWRVAYSFLFPVLDVESSTTGPTGDFGSDQPRQQLLLD